MRRSCSQFDTSCTRAVSQINTYLHIRLLPKKALRDKYYIPRVCQASCPQGCSGTHQEDVFRSRPSRSVIRRKAGDTGEVIHAFTSVSLWKNWSYSSDAWSYRLAFCDQRPEEVGKLQKMRRKKETRRTNQCYGMLESSYWCETIRLRTGFAVATAAVVSDKPDQNLWADSLDRGGANGMPPAKRG